jgi:LuxR family transcriptional regulator, maltose regulon positive regulatory protein
MSIPLLTTKLFIPPPRQGTVSRPRLLQKLDDSLHNRRLTLVSAPAGFGKTSLICEWVAKTGCPTAWLSLDEDDNDPLRFWRYVTAAFQTLSPRLGENLATALQAPKPAALPTLISSLINDLTSFSTDLILVLDDYHLVENEAIHESFTFFLDHLPSPVHPLISTRSDPPLQLSRRRGRGELCEIRAADLRFNTAETGELLNEGLKLGLAQDDIRLLEQRTEGWITGLQMAGLSMEGLPDKHGFVAAFNSDDRYVADYLIEEVLHHQPAHIQDFLLKTSLLNRMSAPLCDALLDTHNSQQVLSDLERTNLFIFPLDHRREWYRYHHLFASLLRQRLHQSAGREAVCSLQRKASIWFEENGLLVEAIQICFDCDDLKPAADLLDQHIEEIFAQGELNILNEFGSKLPAGLLRERPHMLMALAWVANATGQVSKVENYTRVLEDIFGLNLEAFLGMEDISQLDALQRAALIEIAVLYSRLALDHFDIAMIQRISQRVLPYLVPERDSEVHLYNLPSKLRPPLVYILGYYNQLIGNVDEAARLFSDAAESGILHGNSHIVALALGELGQVEIARGNLDRARSAFQKAIDNVKTSGNMPTAYVSHAWYGLACLAYEWNDLPAFDVYIQQAIDNGKMWQSHEMLFPVFLLQARRQMLDENWPQVNALLNILRSMPPEFLQTTGTLLDSFQAQVEFRQGRRERLSHWSDTFSPASLSPTPFFQEVEISTAVRQLLALGRLEQVQQMIDPMLSTLQNSGRRGRLLDFLVLKTLLLAAQKQPARAQDTLKQALELAAPQHYVRLFADEGESLQYLLEGLLPDLSGLLKAYVLNILAVFPNTLPPLTLPFLSTQADLVEPLSERELEVLRLISGGISNADIAARLYVSVNTVKKHMTHIFNKLGVENRLQAIEKARQMGIIHNL